MLHPNSRQWVRAGFSYDVLLTKPACRTLGAQTGKARRWLRPRLLLGRCRWSEYRSRSWSTPNVGLGFNFTYLIMHATSQAPPALNLRCW